MKYVGYEFKSFDLKQSDGSSKHWEGYRLFFIVPFAENVEGKHMGFKHYTLNSNFNGQRVPKVPTLSVETFKNLGLDDPKVLGRECRVALNEYGNNIVSVSFD